MKNILTAFKNSELISLKNYSKEKSDHRSIARFLNGTLIKIGIYEFLENKDISLSKQKFSQAGMAFNFYHEFYEKPDQYHLKANQLMWILLSDNVEVYNLLYRNTKYMHVEGEYQWKTWLLSMLQIACGKWDELERSIQFIRNNVVDKYDFLEGKDLYLSIFQGFYDRDLDKIQKGLFMLEEPQHKNKRVQNHRHEKHLSLPSIAIIKLARMHGMEVEIDSKYVPKELLPFQPLEEYTIPYKFLRDYYRKQSVKWRYDPVYPELQDWENDPENPDRKKGGFFKNLFK